MSARPENPAKPKYNTTKFLYETVYPALDAVASGLLDFLNPNHQRSSAYASYRLCCPVCEKKEAYYYAGAGAIICGRQNNCGVTTSLFDAVKANVGGSNFEVLKRLADAAGVRLDTPDGAPAVSPAAQLARLFRKCTRNFLLDKPNALAYLKDVRGYRQEEIDQLPLGYYPDDFTVRQALAAEKADLTLAAAWGLIQPRDKQDVPHLCTDRIIGYWEQPDGSLRIWGRAMADDIEPKYLFSPGTAGMSKAVPYRFQFPGKMPLLCVEGMLDAESLQLLGVPGCGIGGSHIIRSQAAHFAKKGVPCVMHIIDGDIAGLSGAVKSIANCEAVGIPTLIGVTPMGWDDVDKLRQLKRQDRIVAIIDKALTGGEFLARQLLDAVTGPGYRAQQLWQEATVIRESLTPVSAAAFDTILARYGLEIKTKPAQALRLASELLTAGLTLDDINPILAKRFQLSLDLTAAPADGVSSSTQKDTAS